MSHIIIGDGLTVCTIVICHIFSYFVPPVSTDSDLVMTGQPLNFESHD